MPKRDPGRHGQHRRAPHRLPHCAANVADAIETAPEFLRDNWRGGGHQAHTEDEEDGEQVRAQRARRELPGPGPTQYDDVGGLDAGLREVRQNKRIGEQQRGTRLLPPRPTR